MSTLNNGHNKSLIFDLLKDTHTNKKGVVHFDNELLIVIQICDPNSLFVS